MLGEHIKFWRLEAGYSQEELANELGISRVLLGLIERDEKELTNSTAILLSNAFPKNKIPKTFAENYKEGRNLVKIMDSLREQGIFLSQLRDTDFKIKGADLSCMYLGLKPILPKIKEVLHEKYSVNLKFFKEGERVPMFIGNQTIQNISIPYLKGLSIDNIIATAKERKFDNFPVISVPFSDLDIDLFLDIFGDNIQPTFKGREILGIKKSSVENINFGTLYLIQFINGECQLRRIFQNSDSKQVILKKEDEKFPEVVIDIKSIRTLFAVKTVITKDFY